MEIIEIFRERMASDGIVTKEPIISDGELHRIHIEGDKSGSRNGWYVLYLDHIASGAFGSWKADISKKWCIKSRDRMTRNEWLEYHRKMEDAYRQRKQAKAYEHKRAGERAREIWKCTHAADPNHPYLVKKSLFPFAARQRDDVLILPVMNLQNTIWSLQFINADGSKLLLFGGAKKSNFIPVNGTLDNTPILICEGWATGATLATDNPSSCVIAAIDANNLESVASKIRLHKPRTEIIICADDDRLTQGNPGQTKARRAAIVSGALFSSPQWPSNAPESLTDFNDLACWLRKNKEAVA